MKKSITIALCFSLCILGILGGFLIAKSKEAPPTHREIIIVAKKYGYEPAVLRVNQGDKITLKLTSKDATHGFYLEGYDFDAKVRAEMPYFWIRHPSKSKEYDKEPVESYTFTANKTGKFRYRCSIGCGSFHPFMQGELIVEPNYLFPVSTGLAIGMLFACIIYFRRKKE